MARLPIEPDAEARVSVVDGLLHLGLQAPLLEVDGHQLKQSLGFDRDSRAYLVGAHYGTLSANPAGGQRPAAALLRLKRVHIALVVQVLVLRVMEQ